MPRIRFKPRFVPTIAAVIGVLVTALLGNWQLNRAAEKARLQQRIDQAERQAPRPIGSVPVQANELAYLRVEAQGEYKSDGTVYVDNRVRNGVPGYEIITPLRIGTSSRYVLVKRGWLAAGPSRSKLPAVVTPSGALSVEGVALPGNPRLFELSRQVQSGALWQNVTVDRYHAAFGLELQPVVIEQHNELADGLLREWNRPDAGVDRHRAYALQWFGLCLAIIILYLATNVRRAAPRSSAA